jgi:hypothetical protein
MKLSSVNPSCLEEIAALTKRQKEIRKEKNRITAKLSRDRKNTYIHALESMLQDANDKVVCLERELAVTACQGGRIYTQTSTQSTDTAGTSLKGEEEESRCSALDDLLMSFDSDSE